MAFYAYFREVVALNGLDIIGGLLGLARECGWWAPLKGAAILQHRHSELHLDDRGRLHREDGPAVAYPDGLVKVYAWHGQRVSDWIIERPDEITITKIRAEQNAEVRRVMRERFGEGRYLSETGARLIHADHGGARGKGAAPRALLEDDEGQRWLVGTDGSTGRTYYMRVPREVETCASAHAIRCGFDESRILNAG